MKFWNKVKIAIFNNIFIGVETFYFPKIYFETHKKLCIVSQINILDSYGFKCNKKYIHFASLTKGMQTIKNINKTTK